MKKGVYASWWKLIIEPEDRFEITEKGKKYLRREKAKETLQKKLKVIKK